MSKEWKVGQVVYAKHPIEEKHHENKTVGTIPRGTRFVLTYVADQELELLAGRMEYRDGAHFITLLGKQVTTRKPRTSVLKRDTELLMHRLMTNAWKNTTTEAAREQLLAAWDALYAALDVL